MAETQDAMLSILRNIQQDMKALRAKVDDIAESLLEVKTEVSTLNRYMSHHMGVTTQISLICAILSPTSKPASRRSKRGPDC